MIKKHSYGTLSTVSVLVVSKLFRASARRGFSHSDGGRRRSDGGGRRQSEARSRSDGGRSRSERRVPGRSSRRRRSNSLGRLLAGPAIVPPYHNVVCRVHVDDAAANVVGAKAVGRNVLA